MKELTLMTPQVRTQCPAWCDGDHPTFTDHMSTRLMCFVPLVTDNSEKLQLYLEQFPHEVGPRIVVEHIPAGDPKFSILPLEAVHFSDTLRRLARIAVDANKFVKCEPCDQHPT
jgi:hypothetical protein